MSPSSQPLIVESQTLWKKLIGKAAGFTALLWQEILSVCSSIGDGERAVKAHGAVSTLSTESLSSTGSMIPQHFCAAPTH